MRFGRPDHKEDVKMSESCGPETAAGDHEVGPALRVPGDCLSTYQSFWRLCDPVTFQIL